MFEEATTEKTATSKLLFISVFNYGSIELAKNHVASMKKQGIDNYMCFVTDQASVDELTKFNIKSNLLCNMDKFGISLDVADFGKDHFNRMSYLRYYVIRDLLKRGYDVWYMDVDTVVMTNLNTVYNLLINDNSKQNDIFFQTDINCLCTGCALYFNTKSALNVVNTIIGNKMDSENDQVVFHNLLLRVIPPNQIKIGIFNPAQFPNGMLYFGDDFVNITVENHIKIKEEYKDKINRNTVFFVHANWMVGNATKIAAFKKYNLWFLDDVDINANINTK